MRISAAFLLIPVVAVFGLAQTGQTVASETDTSNDKANIDFLLDSAAKDFRTHPPQALAFRNVYFGQFDSKGNPPTYEICGEFQVAKDGKKQWLHFATLKTSGYEQYVGDGELSWCTREGMSWDEDDWSAELTKRYRKK